jgi:hypothetical protein
MSRITWRSASTSSPFTLAVFVAVAAIAILLVALILRGRQKRQAACRIAL